MSYDSRPDTFEHIHEVRRRLATIIEELHKRAIWHDRSKLEDPELSIFDEYTPKLRELTYGSPEYHATLNEMLEKGMGRHYQANDHHPEHFENGVHDMDLVQLMEMLCDWKTATLRHDDGDIERSIRQNAERFGYGPELTRILLNTVPLIDFE